MIIKQGKFGMWLPVLLICLLTGCGYHLAGTGGKMRKHLRTISVPVFDNSSTEPLIQRGLTDAIRQAFLTDGRLKLVHPKKADLLLTGAIVSFQSRSVAFNKDDVVTESIITLGVHILVKDQVKKEVYMEDDLKTTWDYRSDSLIINSEAARQQALREAFRDLALRLVSLVIDKF